MKKLIITIIIQALILTPLMVCAEDQKAKKEVFKITEVRPFDMQTVNAISVQPFVTVGYLREYMKEIKHLDENIYRQLDPMLHELEFKNTMYNISNCFYYVSLAAFILIPYYDQNTPSWTLAPMATGVIGMLLFLPNKGSVMRFIHKHNELLKEQKQTPEISSLKLLQFNYSF